MVPGKQKVVSESYHNFPLLAPIRGSLHVVVRCHAGARKISFAFSSNLTHITKMTFLVDLVYIKKMKISMPDKET